nr:probable E3 ubiquitin-protein ligase RHC1A [Tanacetum cinerariifolium]
MSQHAGAGGDASGLYEFVCLECGNKPRLPITDSGYTTVCAGCNENGNMYCIDPRHVALECPDSVCVYSRSRNHYKLSMPPHICHNCETREKANGKLCPICIEKFKMGDKLKELPCRHAFHTDCIAGWPQTCPICRREQVRRTQSTDIQYLYSPPSRSAGGSSGTPPSRSAGGSRGTPGGTRNRNNNGRDENEIDVTWTPPPNPLSWDNYLQTVFSHDSNSQLRDSRTPPTSSR